MQGTVSAPAGTPASDRPRSAAAARGLLGRSGQALVGYLFLAPSLVIFGIFVFYPLVKSVYLGFFVSNPFNGALTYVGTSQYHRVLTSADFHNALENTFIFAFYAVVVGVALSLALALLANTQIRGIAVFRTLFSSTIATSAAAAALMWLLLFNPSIGVFNWLLSLIHVAGIGWLTTPRWALFSVAMATVWLQLGFNTLVLLAGLQGIPDTIYESARVDGARPLRQFFSITLPMLSPSLFFVIVISSIRAFESFGQIDLLTQGGPNGSTYTLVYSVYRNAFFNFGATGVASAQAVVLFLVIMLFTVLQFTVAERAVFYG